MIFQASTALILGLGIGFINSIPIGPINVSIIDTGFKRGFRHAIMIGLGALVVDIFYCVIGIFGVSLIKDYIVEMFQPLGFPVLALIGGRLVYKGYRNKMVQTFHPPTQKELTKNFSLGFLIYLTNPLAIGFWIITAGFIFSHRLIERNMPDQVSFISGMAIGTAAWFFSLAKIVAYKRAVISEKTVKKITMATGTVLIVFGIYLGYDFLLYLKK
ncbi:hypothetical protein F9K33_05545 [bacterium]|nr:MAG: hypothetical protein F9K33_05545 [bacterium]